MLRLWLNAQYDYLIFGYGLIYFAVAIAAFFLPRRLSKLPWNWFSGFAILQTLAIWIQLPILLHPSFQLQIAHAVGQGLSYLALLEFTRVTAQRYNIFVPGRLVLVIGAILATTGALGGMADLELAIHYLLGVPGFLLAGILLWYLGKTPHAEPPQALRGLAGVLLLGSLAMLCTQPLNWLSPMDRVQFSDLGLSAILPLMFTTGLLAIVIRKFWNALIVREHRVRQSSELLIQVSFLLIFLMGWLLTNWQGNQLDSRLRTDIIEQGHGLAQTLYKPRLQALTFTASDATIPEYQRLCRQLQPYAQLAGINRISIIAQKQNQFLLGPTNQIPATPTSLPPGMNYPSFPAELAAVFQTTQDQVIGPYQDESGIFVQTFVPILDSTGQHASYVLGIETNGAFWIEQITRIRLHYISLTLILNTIVLLGLGLLHGRIFISNHNWFVRHLEVQIAFTLGLLLTVIGTMAMRSLENERNHEEFHHLAREHYNNVFQSFDNIRQDLSSLARFIENTETLNIATFNAYSLPLSQKTGMVALAWVPIVTESAKQEFLANLQQSENLENFQISPATPNAVRLNECYYPITFIVPNRVSETKRGLDLGTVPILRDSLAEALQFELPCISLNGIGLTGEPPPADTMDALIPVFNHEEGTLRGLVMCEFHTPTALGLKSHSPSATQCAIRAMLYTNQHDMLRDPSYAIPAQWNHEHQIGYLREQYSVYPLFIFGHTWATVLSPGFDIQNQPLSRMVWLTGISGLALTLLFSILVELLTRYRLNLEGKIQTTFSELDQKKNMFLAGPVVAFKWLPNESWLVDYVSPNITDCLGYTPEQLQRSTPPYEDLIHPEDRSSVHKNASTHLNDPNCQRFQQQYRLLHGDGSWRWVDDYRTVNRNPKGQVTSINGYIIDITANRKAELRLRENEQRLDLVIKGMNAGLWDWQITNDLIIINDRWAEMLGYTQDELAPIHYKTWQRLCHPDDLAMTEQLLHDHFSGKMVKYHSEHRMRHKDGHWIWIQSQGDVVEKAADGTPLRMTGTHMDVTTNKLAEEQLLAGKQQMETILWSMQSGVIIVDRVTSEVIEANPAACNTIGLPRDQVLHRLSINKLFSTRTNENAKPSTRADESLMTRMYCADGREITVLRTVVPVTLGERNCLVISFVDVTREEQQKLRLQNVLNETQRVNDLMVQREERIMEIKDEVNRLLHELGRESIYNLTQPEVKNG